MESTWLVGGILVGVVLLGIVLIAVGLSWRRHTRVPQQRGSIGLHPSAAANATLAAAWTVYGGTQLLWRTEEFFKRFPHAKGYQYTFEEEVESRTEMARFWQVKKKNNPAIYDSYLDQLVNVFEAGFMPEYVWTFLRDHSWPKVKGLRLAEFQMWQQKHLPNHQPVTLAIAKQS